MCLQSVLLRGTHIYQIFLPFQPDKKKKLSSLAPGVSHRASTDRHHRFHSKNQSNCNILLKTPKLLSCPVCAHVNKKGCDYYTHINSHYPRELNKMTVIHVASKSKVDRKHHKLCLQTNFLQLSSFQMQADLGLQHYGHYTSTSGCIWLHLFV